MGRDSRLNLVIKIRVKSYQDSWSWKAKLKECLIGWVGAWVNDLVSINGYLRVLFSIVEFGYGAMMTSWVRQWLFETRYTNSINTHSLPVVNYTHEMCLLYHGIMSKVIANGLLNCTRFKKNVVSDLKNGHTQDSKSNSILSFDPQLTWKVLVMYDADWVSIIIEESRKEGGRRNRGILAHGRPCTWSNWNI